MLDDLQPIYVYRTHLDDGLNVVQMAWKVDDTEECTNVWPDEAHRTGLGHMTCLPMLIMRDTSHIVETVPDELER